MNRPRKLLHIFQFIAGLAMFPLAFWFYRHGDYLGVGLALVAGAVVVGYTAVNLFVRQWP